MNKLQALEEVLLRIEQKLDEEAEKILILDRKMKISIVLLIVIPLFTVLWFYGINWLIHYSQIDNWATKCRIK